MIIQGVAGSGKTSIALHRIAFLLYRFKDRLAAINDFKTGGNASLGIIMKTNHAAKVLYGVLADEYDSCLISPESTSFSNGITITSVQMSKGLEFDEVTIPHASSDSFGTKQDRSLLYIACTRAMHRLTLTYTGVLSCLIDERTELAAYEVF